MPPASGSSEPQIVRRNVVLPWPLSPTMPTRWPCSISICTSLAISPVGVADRHLLGPQGGPLPRLHFGKAESHGGLGAGDVDRA